MKNVLRIALLQTSCTADKQSNLRSIAAAVREAAGNRAQMCLMGEIVNSPYDRQYMSKFAEDLTDSPTLRLLQQLSKECGVYTVCSIPERRQDGVLYNTGIVVMLQNTVDISEGFASG